MPLKSRITVRRAIFYVHWFLGISIGFVLALMGITGALLSYEEEIMKLLSHSSPASVSMPALPPSELFNRLNAQTNGAIVGEIRLSSNPAAPVIARVQGESRESHAVTYVDPASGTILGTSNGGAFFGFVEQLHRFLALPAGEGEKSSSVGRQVTGAATLALVFFGLSGLYLKWPAHPLRLRSWFALDLGKSGKNLYRELHAVIGVWVLPLYLMSALSGLTWSYDWWGRVGVGALGVEVQQGKPGEGPKSAQDRQRHAMEEQQAQGVPRRSPDRQSLVSVSAGALDTAWVSFTASAGKNYGVAAISLPRTNEPLRIQRVAQGSPRTGIPDTYLYDPKNGHLRSVDLQATRPLGATIGQSMLAFHSGMAFGETGRILVTVASVLMPGFLVTGLLLYIARRKVQRESHVDAPAGLVPAGSIAEVLVSYASQGGTARKLAALTASAFVAGGQLVRLCSVAELTAIALKSSRKVLFVVSTYGDGEPPDEGRSFDNALLAKPFDFKDLSYGVLALGDREYPEFCAFGTKVDRWLSDCGAQRTLDLVQLDGRDPSGLRRWIEGLQKLGASVNEVAWASEPLSPWTIVERTQLNQAEAGSKLFLVRLAPIEGPLPSWRAGDLVEIQPGSSDLLPDGAPLPLGAQDATVEQAGADPLSGAETPLAPDYEYGEIGESELVPVAMEPVATREYSIASAAGSQSLHLVVRQVHRNGTLGLGSGWLTKHCAVGGITFLRIRSNPAFHQPSNCQMILIGSGTGMAGLRAHLQENKRSGHWLIFGERHPLRDAIFAGEIAAWLSSGHLDRFDAAWSRGDAEKCYVQHLVVRSARELRNRVACGAVIFVWASRTGMGGGVDEALRQVLGNSTVEGLLKSGQYRRDVY